MRSLLALGFVFSLLLAVSGCSNKKSESLKPLPLPVIDKSTKVKVKKVWSAKVGKGQDRRYTHLVPAIVDDTVFAADTNGNVVALDIATGKRQWKSSLRIKVAGAVGAGFGQVLLGTYEGDVISLDADDGKEQWRAKVSSEVLSAPQTNGTIVAVTTIDARLFALDADTGEKRWSHDHVSPVLTQRGTASPVMTSSQVIAAFDNGQVLSFSTSDGSVGWEARVANPKGSHDLEKMVDVDGQPVTDNTYVYTSAHQGSTLAVARGAGREIWKRDISSTNSPTIDDSQLYVASEDGRIVALNRLSGATNWENDKLLRRGLGGIGVMGEAIVTVDDKGHMHVLDKTNGEFIARIKPKGKGFRAKPLSHDDGVFLLSNSGVLSYYKLAK